MDTQPASPRAYKRRTWIINGAFQYRFIGLVMLCVAVAVAIIAVDTFTLVGRYAAATDPTAVERDGWLRFLVKICFYMGGVYGLTLVVSHRIAGPLYRLKKSFQEAAQGDLTHRAMFRKADEWHDIRESFNEMIEALQRKALADAGHAEAARKALEELVADGALPPGPRDKVRQVLQNVSAVGKGFKLS